MTAPPPVERAAKQPRGLFLLFGVEMWERFSYYGMRALLILYLIDSTNGGMGWSKESAAHLYKWYTSMVYVTPVVGGYLADRFLGLHRSLIIGGVIIAAGHFALALPLDQTFFAGLVLIVIGTGFFKSNVSTLVGKLYPDGDRRKDGGFTIFYMGINLGALLGPLICGALAESPRFGWHWGFGAAGVGMVLGLVMYVLLKRKYLGDIGEVPARLARGPGAAEGQSAADGAGKPRLTREERHRVLALFIIAFFVIFFWAAFEQAGSSMNIFALERTERTVFGRSFPASWFQSLNPAYILIGAPLFASLWLALGKRKREPSTPAKMALGLMLLGLGFVFMVVGAARSEGGQRVSPFWLTAAFAFHTAGELCLSPIGLSLVTKLAPARLASMMMGLWFLSTALADWIAGLLAAYTERIARGEVFQLLGGQADFFLIFVVSSLLAGIGLAAMTPRLKRLMHGRDV